MDFAADPITTTDGTSSLLHSETKRVDSKPNPGVHSEKRRTLIGKLNTLTTRHTCIQAASFQRFTILPTTGILRGWLLFFVVLILEYEDYGHDVPTTTSVALGNPCA